MPDRKTPPTENNPPTRKRGRPRKPPQQGPLIASAIRSQVTRLVYMGAYTAREAEGYVNWASAYLHITKQDAMTLLQDRALAEFLKKDRCWKAEWRRLENQGGKVDDVTDEHPAVENEILR
jgi:hypothetical protein